MPTEIWLFIHLNSVFAPLLYISENTKNIAESLINDKIEKILSPVSSGDFVFVQYPTWLDFHFEKLLMNKLLLKPGIKVALVLWDVISWLCDSSDRDFKNDADFILMNRCHLIISPNEKMSARLVKDGGVRTPVINMGLSDYFCGGTINFEKEFKKEVTFVGTLNKTAFSDYNGKTLINLIGHPVDLTEIEKSQSNLNIMGELSNSEIPGLLNSGFGLVSYQNKNNIPEKKYFRGAERYGHYNNPLKLSLYLAAGLPVIVDSQSPHAERIRKDGLGLIINELNDIDSALDNVTRDDYFAMTENVWNYSLALRNGFFTKTVLRKAIIFSKGSKNL